MAPASTWPAVSGALCVPVSAVDNRYGCVALPAWLVRQRAPAQEGRILATQRWATREPEWANCSGKSPRRSARGFRSNACSSLPPHHSLAKAWSIARRKAWIRLRLGSISAGLGQRNGCYATRRQAFAPSHGHSTQGVSPTGSRPFARTSPPRRTRRPSRSVRGRPRICRGRSVT